MNEARLVPILRCRDVERAGKFYVEMLGATENWVWRHGDADNPGYRSVTLLGQELHLSSFAGDGAYGSAIYIRVPDLAPILDRLRLTPHAIAHGPADKAWGQRELHVLDPDNNALRFGMAIA